MTRYTLTLPFATPSQNQLQRWHWGRADKFKHSCAAWIRVRLNDLGLFGLNRPEGRVRVTIRRFSSGKLDRGNFVGGCKPLLDALRDEGVIRDDSEQWLEDRYEQHQAQRGQGRIEIEVEHLAEVAA